MASVNKVILVGHLGQDPETRYMPSGDAVTTVSLATSEQWKDKESGERREATEWHRIVFFRRLAEVAGQYLKKGALVYIEGKLKTRKWQDKDGQDRYTTEIEATEMKMLGKRERSDEGEESSLRDTGSARDYAAASGGTARPPRPPRPTSSSIADMDDDIPF